MAIVSNTAIPTKLEDGTYENQYYSNNGVTRGDFADKPKGSEYGKQPGAQAGWRGQLKKMMLVSIDQSLKVKFQYNPPEFSNTRSNSFPDIKSPGVTIPYYQFTGGSEQLINLNIFLDCREHRKSADGKNDDPDIEVVVDTLHKMMTPDPKYGASQMTGQFAPPPTLYWVWGEQVVECVLQQIQVTRKMFDRELKPVRAEIAMVLKKAQFGWGKGAATPPNSLDAGNGGNSSSASHP
jgi:hypothetical protein